MAADLKIDGHTLDLARTALGYISSVLTADDLLADKIADAVGQADLAAKVRSFSTAWAIRRAKLEAEVEALKKMLDAVAETFDDTERSLAGALEGRQ